MSFSLHPQLTIELNAQAAPSLSNFIVGQNQALCLRLKALVSGDRSERFIYIWGPAGSGRSHLLAAAGSQQNIYCIDDCEQLDQAAAHQAFVQFTQALIEPQHAIVLAGDRPAAQLMLRADLQSRITQCLSFELKPLSDADLRLALADTIAQRGVRTEPDILNYLLNHLPRNMSALRAALDALDQLSLQRKAPISLAMARELFGRQPD
jgi:DnaA-homolog protein